MTAESSIRLADGFQDAFRNRYVNDQVNDEDLQKLKEKEGVLRIWYIPKQIRSWHHSLLNRRIYYNATFVRAE